MNTLLRSECFDHFLLKEATIASGASFVIDGTIPADFYTEEEKETMGITGFPFLPFSELRGNCFDLIKGKKTPSSFSFVFLLSPDNMKKTLEAMQSTFTEHDVAALFMNIRFATGELVLTTGISYKTFSMDKSLDKEWDTMVRKFLTKNEIEFDEMK